MIGVPHRPIASDDFAIVAAIFPAKPSHLKGCRLKQQFVAAIGAFALFEWHLGVAGRTVELSHLKA